ncbi:MAG: DUF4263 domain-containing protein [Gelidibacter sp.]
MKKTDRLSRWKKKEKFSLFFEHPINPEFQKILDKKTGEDSKISNLDIMKLAKELIFDIKNKKPLFYIICPMLDTYNLEIDYEHCMTVSFSGNKKELEQEVVNTLGIAVAFELPIYPNNKKVEQQLSDYYEKLVRDGFVAPDNEGNDVKLIPTNSKKIEDFKVESFSKIDMTKYWSPSDLLLLRGAVSDELIKLNNAHRTLTSLQVAIEELEKLLNTTKRNENKLQECITKSPILLGLEYSKVIPKHKLGAEYEVDYALEKYTGLIDLMEIESSSLPIFTKQGNPSSYLVHAEQQVIDWLDWVEKNNPYARAKMEGLLTPKGYVIIGRNSNLNEKTKASLIRRNKAFNGLISVLTYDDVLMKAKALFEILNSEKN